jgi:branched-chain amino acid transport system substrate-binding protein
VASLTGNYSTLGKSNKLGAEQAIKEVNSSGGVLDGRKLKLTGKDDKTDPDQAVIDYKDLVSDGVAAVVGSVFTNSNLAVEPQLERKQVPYVSVAAGDQQVEPVNPYLFMTPPTAAAAGEQLLRYFKSQGMTTMAVAYDTDQAFAKTGWKKMKKMAGKYGISFVKEETFETSATDFTSVLTHIRDSGADGLMVWATGPPAVILTKQFASAEMGMKLVMSHAEGTPLYLKPSGKAANGVIVPSSIAVVGPQLPDSDVKHLAVKMIDTYKKNNDAYPPQFAFDGYNAVELIAAAIDKAGSADPQKIRDALDHLTLKTVEGTYHYTPDDHAGLTVDDVAVNVVKDGDFKLTDWSKEQLSKTLD